MLKFCCYRSAATGLLVKDCVRLTASIDSVEGHCETTGIAAVTGSYMRCLVVHHAPLDQSCASGHDPVAGQGACAFEQTDVPAGWVEPEFDDSGWAGAIEHSASDVGLKGGCDRINWDQSAQLI